MSITTAAFFYFHLHGISFSIHSLSVCVSSLLKWVSCRQYIDGFCFCIYSSILCLLIGEFGPFTFKVIIDKYVFIAILNLVFQLILYLFFVPFFLFFLLWFDGFHLYYTWVLFFLFFCESVVCFWFVVNPGFQVC